MNRKDAARASTASPAVSPAHINESAAMNRALLIRPIGDLTRTFVTGVIFSEQGEVIKNISPQEETGIQP